MGYGTFKPAHFYRTGASVFGIAVADMNRDGRPDLIVGGDEAADSPKNHISYFRGRGDGTFKRAIKIPDVGGPEGVVAGDFNGDKHPDFAAANYETGGIEVWHGTNKGKFHRVQTLDDTAGPWLLQSADLNGDGNPDLIAGNYGGDGTNAVTVFLSKKDGTFKGGQSYAGTGNSTFGLAVGKLGPDKHQDVAISEANGQVSWLKGKADGTFADASPLVDLSAEPSFSGLGYGLAIGTFDKPAPDVAVPVLQTGSSGEVYPIRDVGQPGLILAGNPTPVPGLPFGIAAADFNKDGVDDVAVGRGSTGGNGFNLLISKNDLGEFTLPSNGTYSGSDPAGVVLAARLNADKAPDVIVGSGKGVDVYLNKKH
jgi:hypothetical protein